MVKPSSRKLKVFQAQFGFYDSVVAASSQVTALRAWGIHQNLFASGGARITEDPQAVEAALAHPEVPLRRAVGSTDPFALEPANLPKVPNALKNAPKRATAKLETRAEPKPAPRPRSQADRSALNTAEVALQKLDEDRKAEEAALRRRQEDLHAEREAAQAAYVKGRNAATKAIVEARELYRKAGGEA